MSWDVAIFSALDLLEQWAAQHPYLWGLLTAVVGGGIISLVVIRMSVFVKVDRRKEESEQEQTVDGTENVAVQVGHNFGSIAVPGRPGGAAPDLPIEASALIKRVAKILKDEGSRNQFSAKYVEGHRYLEGRNAKLAAPAYWSAFLMVKDMFLSRRTYAENVDERSREALERDLRLLQEFSDSQKTDEQELRRVISSIENSIHALSAYLP